MGARAYGVVGGTVVVVLVLGLGSTTGVGALGTIDPAGPRFSLPSRSVIQAPVVVPSGSPSPQPEFTGFTIPDWVGNAVLVLVLGLTALAVGWFVWRVIGALQRGRHLAAAAASTDGAEVEEIPMSSLAESVEATLEDLRAGLNTDDAILECWRRLERLGENAGARRHDSDTSTEYVERLLQGVPEAGADLAILARLYRSAMFSGLASDPASRTTAVECLERLSGILSARADVRKAVDSGA